MADLTAFLADACAIIRFYIAGSRLSGWVRSIMSDPDVDLAVAAITIWEHPELLRAQGYTLLDLTPEIADQASRLPLHPNHRDPFDRALVAHAIAGRRVILSDDAKLGLYDVVTLW